MYEERYGNAGAEVGQNIGSAVGGVVDGSVNAYNTAAGAVESGINAAGEALGGAYYNTAQAAQGVATATGETASRLAGVAEDLISIDVPEALAMAQQLKTERQRVIEIAERFSNTVNQLLAGGLKSQANSANIASLGTQMKSGATNLGDRLNNFADALTKEANEVQRHEGDAKGGIGAGIDFKF